MEDVLDHTARLINTLTSLIQGRSKHTVSSSLKTSWQQDDMSIMNLSNLSLALFSLSLSLSSLSSSFKIPGLVKINNSRNVPGLEVFISNPVLARFSGPVQTPCLVEQVARLLFFFQLIFLLFFLLCLCTLAVFQNMICNTGYLTQGDAMEHDIN